jgi:uncharacterized pyridoxamine 5'-phosphate oxidase family protein
MTFFNFQVYKNLIKNNEIDFCKSALGLPWSRLGVAVESFDSVWDEIHIFQSLF